MASAENLSKKLSTGSGWLVVSKSGADRLRFLLRIVARIELLKQDFYAADPEHFSAGSPEPAA